MAHQSLAYATAARGRGDGIAGVGLVAAAPHVVGMEYVQPEHLASVLSDSGEVLRGKEPSRGLIRQLLKLRKGHAVAHDLVPDLPQPGQIVPGISPYLSHSKTSCTVS